MKIKDLMNSAYLAERDNLIQHANRHGFEWVARAGLVFIGVMFLGFILKDRYFFVWFGYYFIITLLDFVASRNFARNPSLKTYLGFLATDISDSIISFALFITLWTYGEPYLAICGFVFLSGSFLYSVSGRIRIASLAIQDTLYAQLALTFAWGWALLRTDEAGLTVLLAVALIGLQIFHALTIWGIRSNIHEIENAKRRSLEAHRMEALGRLTGGISHDFNNILTVVLGNLDLYDEVTDQAERKDLVDNARAATKRASALTSQLLAFSRRVPFNRTKVATATVANETQAIVERVLPATINFSIHNDCTDMAVETDGTYLNTAILNLILNARDALSGKGNMCLRIGKKPGVSSQFGKEATDQFVSISVHDDGPGFQSEILTNVFDPYFTTKATGEGSGLGLSMVKGFAEQSKGSVSARNRPQGGAIVEMILPAAK